MLRIPRIIKASWLANRTLILGLTLPLLIASALALWFSRPVTVREIFINLATDFITIIITVWYVNWILHRQEEFRWTSADKYISAEAGSLSHSIISRIAERANLSDEIFPSNDPPLLKRRIEDIQAEIITNVKKLDHDQIIDKLKNLDFSQWSTLMNEVQSKTTDITLLVSQFGSRLNPSNLEVLLSLREAINTAYSAYDIFRNFLGVPISMLPKVKDGKAFNYQVLATIRIGIDLEIILQSALAVIDTFHYAVPPPKIDYNEEGSKSWQHYWQQH